MRRVESLIELSRFGMLMVFNCKTYHIDNILLHQVELQKNIPKVTYEEDPESKEIHLEPVLSKGIWEMYAYFSFNMGPR